jgi:carbamoyltransferase
MILGIHGGYKREYEDDPVGYALHDSTAVLIDDGEIVTAIEEERLNRIKHTNCFPVLAIKHCLSSGGVGLKDLDAIAINSAQYVADAVEKTRFIEDPTSRLLDGRRRLGAIFEREFGVNVADKVRFCNHHMAHAWSAFAPSPFERSLILSIDGDGDYTSGMVLMGEGNRIKKLHEYPVRQSLGHLYNTLIRMLGYTRFDEYKAMGLAPYGDPGRYGPLFAKCFRLAPEGDYFLEDPITWFTTFDAAGLLKEARRKGGAFTQAHQDFAAALQAALETIVLHVLRHYKAVTKANHLCLAGGVAHNCSMNGKVLYSGLFDQVFVQPAAHDAGGALGAAWWAFYSDQPERPRPKLSHLYLGTDIGGDDAVESRLKSWGDLIAFRKSENVAAETAHLLATGSVVGWVQGRSEFGPRALGNRSIIADPRPAGNKDLINQMVKKREAFRPFAPSMLLERAGLYLDLPARHEAFPFMIFVLNIKEEMRSRLGAITHVDGTARVQTVSKDTNPMYWSLISEFEKLTGVAVVLNTSFNNHAEPIVDSTDDAVACFLTTGIHFLVIGNYIVTRRDPAEVSSAFKALAPAVPPHRKLVRRGAASGLKADDTFQIESAKSSDFGPRAVSVSPEFYGVLQGADGQKSLHDLLDEEGVTDEATVRRVSDEVADLWSRRVILLKPAAAR